MFKTNFSRFDSCGQNTDCATLCVFLLALCNAFLCLLSPAEQSSSHVTCLESGPELSRADCWVWRMSRGIGIQPKLSTARASPGGPTVIWALGKAAGAGNQFLFWGSRGMWNAVNIKISRPRSWERDACFRYQLPRNSLVVGVYKDWLTVNDFYNDIL